LQTQVGNPRQKWDPNTPKYKAGYRSCMGTNRIQRASQVWSNRYEPGMQGQLQPHRTPTPRTIIMGRIERHLLDASPSSCLPPDR
jgi:hypothetical protein